MRRIRIVFIYVLLSLIYSVNVCFASDDGKVPITTKSDKAKTEFLKGRDLSDKLRVQESIEFYNNAISEDPDFALAYLYRAQAQTSGQDFTNDLNKAVSLAGKVSEPEKLLILGYQAGINGNTTRQTEMYEKVSSLYPNDEMVHVLTAGTYTIKDVSKGIAHLKKAIKINPAYSPAYNILGYTYKNSGKLSDAEATFKKYIEVLPNDPNPYDSYAELLLKEGKYDEAVTNYKKALSINPDFNSSKVGIATAFIYQGKSNDARNEIQDLLQNAKNNGQKESALRLMAITYVDEGKLDEAVNQIDKEYQIASSYNDYPDMANIHLRKGTVLNELGKYDEAKKELQSSIDAFNKSNATQDAKNNYKTRIAYNNALISMKEQGTQAAAKTNMNLPELKNDAAFNNQANQIKSVMLIEKKDSDGVLKLLKNSNENDAFNLYLMGRAYQVKGDNQKAKEYYNKVISINELPTLTTALARYHTKMELKEIK